MGEKMYSETRMILNMSRRLLLETSLTEKQIAGRLYLSETSLRNLYHKNFGLPPQQYIRLVKMKKAKTLLRIGDERIAEIALSIGYTSSSKFTKAFKLLYGQTPSDYRKKCRFGLS